MRNHFFNLFTSNLKVSARIKNSRVCLHYAAYTCGKSKTYVRVDIDFADSHRSSATEKLFRNTLCAVEIAAAFVDLINEFRNYRRSSVKYNRESGKSL